MAEVSIGVALEKLEGATVAVRNDGLEDLKRIFGHARGSSKLDSLGDAGFQRILESLFTIIRTEKSKHIKATTPTLRNSAELRLSQSSAAFRLVVDAAATRIKHKTAILVLDHVVDTLPVKNAGLFSPIRNDYMKSFRGLLQSSSLREHLRPQEWEDLIEFVLGALDFHAVHDDSQSNGTSSRDNSVDTRAESRTSMRVSQASRGRTGRSDASNHVEEILLSLKLLSATRNPSLTVKSSSIVHCCINYLGAATKFQEPALEALNNVFPSILTNDITLASNAAYRLIPILRRMWSTRVGSLKDQILIFIMNARDLLSSLFTGEPPSDTAFLNDLFNTITLEYGRRQQRDCLQMDDIYFPESTEPLPLRTLTLAPLRDSTRALANWSCVAVLALLVSTLHMGYRTITAPVNTDAARGKRRKIESPLEELIRHASTSTPQMRLYAIQTLLFAFEECEAVGDYLVENVAEVAIGLSSDDDSVANWSMLLMSRFAFTAASKTPGLKHFWIQARSLVARNVSSQSLSRAACHFLNSALKAGVFDDTTGPELVLDMMFANGSQGPCVLTDAALSLWFSILASGTLTSVEALQNVSLKAIGWLNTHWTLPPVLDRLHNASLARYSREDHMYRLLMACMNIATALGDHDFSIATSPVYTRRSVVADSLPVSRFLLHQFDSNTIISEALSLPSSPITIGTSSRARLEHAVCELLITKLKTFQAAWGALRQERSSNVSIDIVQILLSACVIASTVSAAVDDSKSLLHNDVVALAGKLWNDVSGIISSLEGDLQQQCLVMAASSLLKVDPNNREERVSLTKKLKTPMSQMVELLRENLARTQSQSDIEDDLMDSQDSFPVQNSQSLIDSDIGQTSRQQISFPTDLRTAVVQLTCRLLIGEVKDRFGEDGDPRVASAIIDFAVDLNSADLVAARQPLTEFFNNSPAILRTDARRFLQTLAETCLQEVEFERCEAALCFCVDILASLVNLWTVEAEDDLASMACDIYEWYLEIAVGKGIATEKVMLAIARMLTAVSSSDSTFGSGVSLPSPRTSLLRLLKAGNHVVQFNLADLICQIFEGFVLSEHWAIFDDVVASLPADAERVEGIAVRLHILGKLASRWHTLLRKAVYSVFETAAKVTPAMPFAQRCFKVVSDSLHLPKPRELFILFSPQLLYTWLEKESLDSIPFQAFEYKDLLSLLQDVQDEAVGQIAMRANTSHAKRFTQITGMTWEQMLHDSFTQAESYCVARDISTPRGEQARASEAMLRTQLGNDIYLKLIQENFPQILARLFTIISDDHGVEQALSKRKSLSPAQAALLDVCKRSQSSITLPKGQQPSFRSKYVFDELDYLCKRIDRDSTSIWEPSLVVYVCRRLFDSAMPALGPLHSCAVIRKVRTVVCLAGSQALRGYPLEMLLHTLRPFLTDFHCSEDALGLFWYLLDHGKPYLESQVSFLTSLAVSTFATISSFLGSSQDSTTQESHFKSTMGKVQTFREWMLKYVQTFKPGNVSAEKSRTFSTITRLAAGINDQGGNTKGTPQGDLIYHLLQDQISSDRLLTRTAFVQVMELLCINFRGALDPKDDILYLDEDAFKVGQILLALIAKVNSSSFAVWVAQVIGRAYACCGSMQGGEDNDRSLGKIRSSTDDTVQRQSYANVVDSLATMLRKDDRRMSGMAERALQLIFTALTAEQKATHFSTVVEKSLLDDLSWTAFLCPHSVPGLALSKQLHAPLIPPHEMAAQTWACNLTIALCGRNESDPILAALPVVLAAVPALAMETLPCVVHIVLLAESSGHRPIREALSAVISETLAAWRQSSKADHIRIALEILLYLRHQPLPRESNMADRNAWLNVSLTDAAAAASTCGMQAAALLFLELAVSQQALQQARTSMKSSVTQLEEYNDLLQQVFYRVDDPDFFFGMQEKQSLQSVLSKLAHEDSAYKNLSFQSALFDAECRISNTGLNPQDSDVVGALSRNNLNGIARAVQLQASPRLGNSAGIGVLQLSMNLNQWDLPLQVEQQSAARVVMGTFRALESFSSKHTFMEHLDTGLRTLLFPVARDQLSTKTIQSNFSAMAVLTELRELFSATDIEGVREEMANRTARARWEAQESFGLVSPILLGREAAITALNGSDPLRSHFKVSLHEARLLEINTIRDSFKVARSYSEAQFCLNRAMYLSKLMETPAFSLQKVEAAIMHDTAHVLWDQGEASASIQMLRQLEGRKDLEKQAITVSRAEILADLGHHTAEARLSKPDEIIANYLVPAIKELHGKLEGAEAGRVFHNFAVFCDMQLQNAEDKEEFARVESMRQSKLEEIEGLTELIKSADPKRKESLKKHLDNAKRWFKLDDEEYQRLKKIRERFIAQSLENYLRSMAASDVYFNDTLRFVALWLDQSESGNAQTAVEKYIATVSSRKFAPLMNQLFSRILDKSDLFQQLLTTLLYRVCCDHPHHSLYQLFAASKSKGTKNDVIANSRYSAAGKLADKVMKQSHSGNLWVAFHNCSIAFVRLANEKLADQKVKSGSKLLLRNIETGRKLEQTVHDSSTKIPPPTMRIALRADCDYSSTPAILRFNPEISIAGGVSAPKILTIIATDGSRHKMLLKGGNDDLRQDSIMEQVFEQVSNLLKDHRTTRQRNLGIRTYKVLPLTPNAGIIEFVKDTIPLHDYLLPAHQKYYPKDWKPAKCRKDIADAQSKPLAQRVQAYRTVCANFHPVMRFFFMERFLEPDEWFKRRIAFSRSVAATSILGHVLGLGDRHGHNILLDEKTGEVVHIDLGVAFETGRILPVPEVVPFRLTRDLVDGMGISGVEGVFRRCCNFTLEALRQDQYSIMTVLDVLRYDPLYSWSITPLRLQRMQEAQEMGRDGDNVEDSRRSSHRGRAVTPEEPKPKKMANEASEADRALTVVAKKLGKGLSVEATVNELIQQATDEKNLATLYCGWAAYA